MLGVQEGDANTLEAIRSAHDHSSISLHQAQQARQMQSIPWSALAVFSL
jgi:hypothetical protein